MRSGDWDRIYPRLVLLVSVLTGSVLNCLAHPMGNFSVNHYSKITIGQNNVEVLYLIDMAEIPTFQEMRQFGITSVPDDLNTARYLNGQAQTLKEGLSLEIDGRNVQFDALSSRIVFADGAGGLTTMKIELRLQAKLDALAAARNLSYFDHNFPGRAGWKEIVVSADGVALLDTSASSIDRSQRLTNYSSDVLNSPPQQLSALVTFKAEASQQSKYLSQQQSGSVPDRSKSRENKMPIARLTQLDAHQHRNESPSVAQAAAPVLNAGASSPVARPSSATGMKNTPRSRLTELISTRHDISLWILLSAGLIAAGLGALHALEPGHGKTIVAAYLVGSRGTVRHAVLLGVVVTAAHTAGVYALGIVTLYASRYIVPDHLYPWLGAISGLSVAGLGTFTFLRHLTGHMGEHSHAMDAKHAHSFFSMSERTLPTLPESVPCADGEVEPGLCASGNRSMSLRALCMLGISGGIVPCPAALVVLLSAFSLHRIGFGLFLITAFSAGLALVLVTVGIVMVYGKRFLSARLHTGKTLARFLPVLSSGFMALLGVGITVSAVASLHSLPGAISKGALIPFVTVITLGVLLGMRHSTDADHVVAISTIVSRQGSLKGSATIGLLWGLGHTITIFLVGSAIIVFGVVIPPRLGLSMEFCVALMLILLGILNISGALRWLMERFTRLNMGSIGSRGKDRDVSQTAILANTNANPWRTVWNHLEITLNRIGVYQTIRPLVVGLVHGLAGSAAVALLVLSTIKSPLWATAYLLVFGFGTMAGMMFMTSAISIPLVYTKKRFSAVTRHLAVFSGFLSMGFGLFLVYHIGFVDGLFTSHTHWTPQ